MEDEIAPLNMVAIKPPRQLQVVDDWFVLLDVAPKTSGIYRVDFTDKVEPYRSGDAENGGPSVYSPLATVGQRVHPDVQPAKQLPAVEPNIRQRITVETEAWRKDAVFQEKSLPAGRELEDDWFILLDVATKKSVRS